jgi:hypothetical protein
VPFPITTSPATPVDDDERWALIERLLHDASIAIELRIAGLLNLHPIIAVRWVRAARGDWATYVGQRTVTTSPDPADTSSTTAQARE